MSKKIKIILVVVALVFVFSVILMLFLTGVIGGNGKKRVKFQNQGKTYCVILDNYLPFRDCTSTSKVNNEDGLELNYQDTYITIQRFPIGEVVLDKWALEDFQNYVDGEGYSNMNQTEIEVSTMNHAIKEIHGYKLSVTAQNKTFHGILYYFRTDKAFYKVLISGSNSLYVGHYKNFIDIMQFTE